MNHCQLKWCQKINKLCVRIQIFSVKYNFSVSKVYLYLACLIWDFHTGINNNNCNSHDMYRSMVSLLLAYKYSINTITNLCSKLLLLSSASLCLFSPQLSGCRPQEESRRDANGPRSWANACTHFLWDDWGTNTTFSPIAVLQNTECYTCDLMDIFEIHQERGVIC